MKVQGSRLSQHLTQFASDSSIRSLRRTVLSDSVLLRAFWTVFVLGCFSGMTCHLTLLSLNFVKGDLAVDLQFSSNADEPFPSVSYCYGSQFSESARRHLATGQLVTPSNFSNYVRDQVKSYYQREPSAERGFLLLIESYNNYLATVLGALGKANRSLHEIAKLRVGTLGPIIRVLLVTGRVLWLVPSDYSLVPFYHPDHISCYTITLPVALSKLAQSIMLVMPTEINSTSRFSYGFPIDGLTSVSGFVLDLHSEFAVPFSHSKLLLPNNYYNQVKFTQCSLQRLACSNLPGWFTEYRIDNGTLLKRYFHYTKEMCIVEKIRDEVVRHCNCTLDMGLMNLTDRKMRCNAFLPEDTVETYFLRNLCVDNVLNSSQGFEDNCESSCQEIWFPATVSGANHAPMNDQQRCFVEKTIFEVNYRGAGISDVEAALLNDTSSDQSAAKLCANASRSNVFIAELSRNPFLLQSFRQNPITTLAVFLCQVGSICGIWSGLSIAIIGELADLIFRLTSYGRKAAKVSVGTLQLESRKAPKTISC